MLAQMELGTLFCPTAGESFHGCTVQQLPEDKNTSVISTHNRKKLVTICILFKMPQRKNNSQAVCWEI